jgi:aminoglycoside phosphotransferase (APT) family kinase protein
MNPETKLTKAQLTAICAEQAIPYVSHERVTTGFSHEVHRLNDDLIIKVYDADYQKNFMTETAVLQANLHIPKPSFRASGTVNGTDRSYVIMSYVPGTSLGGMWHLATDEQREKLIEEICGALKAINTLPPHVIHADTSETWQGFLRGVTSELVDKLLESGIISHATALQTGDAIERYAVVFTDEKMKVVFWDIHFDNFIVDEHYTLQAVIDLESTMLASLDYPLFVIQKMTDFPHKYLREDEEKYARVKDYVHIRDWYRKYYPAMFEVEQLDTRLKMYQLYDALHLLKDWHKNSETYDELNRLIQ